MSVGVSVLSEIVATEMLNLATYQGPGDEEPEYGIEFGVMQ
jgi:hypothetical protein